MVTHHPVQYGGAQTPHDLARALLTEATAAWSLVAAWFARRAARTAADANALADVRPP